LRRGKRIWRSNKRWKFKGREESEMDAKKSKWHGNGSKGSNEWRVKVGLAEMLKGGVIMDSPTRNRRRSLKKRALAR